MQIRFFGWSASVVACSFLAACNNAVSTTPIATPVVLSVTSLAFTAPGSANAQSFSASQSNYSGNFTASTPAAGSSNSCSSVATITPSSGTSFSVTPLAAGQCAFTISGYGNQTATLTVGVTTATVGGS
jgi:hypothetical protein